MSAPSTQALATPCLLVSVLCLCIVGPHSAQAQTWPVEIVRDGLLGAWNRVGDKVTIATNVARPILGRLGDVDGDPDLDVTLGGFGAVTGDIGWIENLGGGIIWAYRVFVSEPTRVGVDAFDLRGRLVARLLDDKHLEPGTYGFVWTPVPSVRTGAYFLRLDSGSGVRARKVILTR